LGSTALADKPLDVDCEALAATNECVNAILDEQGVQFQNLGDLVSSAILDEEVFDALDALILLCSGGGDRFRICLPGGHHECKVRPDPPGDRGH